MIVYLGGLYAGGVLGLKKTLGSTVPGTGQKLLIATVGLADPGISENRYHIRGALQRQLPKEAYERARNQAKTVAHWASQYSTDKLLDEKNVTNLRNQVVRQLVKKSGMDSATAEAQAEHVINLIKQQKGIE